MLWSLLLLHVKKWGIVYVSECVYASCGKRERERGKRISVKWGCDYNMTRSKRKRSKIVEGNAKSRGTCVCVSERVCVSLCVTLSPNRT